MTQDTLKQAISLSRAGKKLEARELLEGILKSDPLQEVAWLWFADTYQSAGRRLQVLDTALHLNPHSQMVVQAREALLVSINIQSKVPAGAYPQTTAAVKQTTDKQASEQPNVSGLYLVYDSQTHKWRATTTPLNTEETQSEQPGEAPSAPPAEDQPDESRVAPQVEQSQTEDDTGHKLMELQFQGQAMSVGYATGEGEQFDDELDPDTIVAESFVDLLQAELDANQSEPAPDWMDNETRRIEQLINQAGKETNGSSEPPAEPAEALQWVPESEAAEPGKPAEPEQPAESAEAKEPNEENQPAAEKSVEDTRENKSGESSD
jgi:hypothetical protein